MNRTENEKKKGKAKPQNNILSVPLLNWTERGPNRDFVGPYNENTRANGGVTAGRIRAVMIDSADPTHKTVWVGCVSGGLWKTNDITRSPANWILVNDFIGNLDVAAICQDPTDYNTMYFCTGDAYSPGELSDFKGVGVFKSIDHGVTWSYLSSTHSFTRCSRILCDYEGNIYLATHGNGVLRSTKESGGALWTDITPFGSPNLDICDMEISSTAMPGRFHITTGIFSTSKYFYTDIASTVSPASGWNTSVTPYVAFDGRTEIACSGNTLYALPSDNYMVPAIYKSTDGGVNWIATQPLPDLLTNQGYFDLSVGINPSDPNQCIVGGRDCFKTMDGGAIWTQISNWVNYPVNGQYLQYVHADQHNVQWWDGGTKLLLACDGGIHYSSDGGITIRDRNKGLRIKQFYSVAIDPVKTDYFLGGTQDNGTHQLTQPGLGFSTEVIGGDGGFTAIDQDEPQYQYGTYIYNNFRRSTDGGNTWSNLDFSGGSFINPYDLNNTTNIIYAGNDQGNYLRWNDPHTGNSTSIISPPSFNGRYVNSVTVSPYTANRVYFGVGSKVVQVDNANTATPSDVNLAANGMIGYLSCVAVGTNDQNLMATFSSYGVRHVWVSSDGGASWTIADGNLPDMPVRWGMFFPGDNTKALIATETGVWETDLFNGTNTVWTPNPTFPTVRTDMIKYRAGYGLFVAATHGRGIWTSKLGCPGITVINPVITSGNMNVPFLQRFNQTGGEGSITYTTNSELPAGMVLTASGYLAGTPTMSGIFPIIVIATDANSCNGTSTTYNLYINNSSCPTINVINPAYTTAVFNAGFSQDFTASGGIPPFTFNTNSTLPIGLSLSAEGTLSGIPVQFGTFPIVVTAKDINACTGTGSTYLLSIVCPGITVTKPLISSGTNGITFSQTFISSASATPVTYSTVSILPTGLTLSTSGVLSGTPTQNGTFPIIVTVVDANGCSGNSTIYNLVINTCPVLTVNTVSNQVVCNGAATAPVTFSGGIAGTIYKWRNSRRSIGLAASGKGDIPSFIATNIGSLPIVATITVTPTYISGGITCTGTSTSFKITVNPPDVIATPSSQTVCSGSGIIPIQFTGTTNGAIFSWARDNTASVTGIAASGTGDISGVVTNTTNAPITVSFTITPAPDGCPGVTRTATIVVNPIPTLAQPASQALCNGETTTAVNFTTLSGTKLAWTNNTPSIGLAASGKGDIAAFTANNNSNAPVMSTVTVTGTSSGVFAYIANASSNSVSVINTVTNEVVTTIKVGIGPFCVAVSPDGNRVYVTNINAGTVSAISTSSNTVIATVPVGDFPTGVAVSPDGSHVYVSNNGSDNISVINTASNSVDATIPAASGPDGIALTPDGKWVYVANNNTDDVSVINTATNLVVATIGVGSVPYGISISPDGSKVYVTNDGADNISVINTATNLVQATIPGGYGVCGIAVSPDGNHVYVVNSGDNNISVINTATNLVEATINVGLFPVGVSVSPDGRRVYVTNNSSNNVSVINTVTNAEVATIPVGLAPVGYGNFIGISTVCQGNPKTFNFTINPTPNAVATPATQKICVGTAMTPIVLSGNVSGTIYNWTRDNTAAVTGIAASGTGDISGTLTNTTSLPVTVIFTITPIANGCPGTPTTATVVVNPSQNTVSITAGNPAGFCGDYTISLSANPSPAGAYTYSWSTGAAAQSINLNRNSPDGNYTVVVTNSIGCTRTAIYSYTKENITNSYTILGLKDVNLGETNIVAKGSVGNSLNNGKVTINKNSTVTGTGAIIKASQVILNAPVAYNLLVKSPVTTVLPAMLLNTKTTNGLSSFKVANNVTVTINTNYKELEIGKAANVTINGTIYGAISIKEGATVTFTQPVVYIEYLSTESGKLGVNYTSIKFTGNTAILIKNKITIGERNRINYLSTTTAAANNVTFYMSNPVADLESYTIAGKDTRIAANIYMPAGKLVIAGYDANKCYMTGVYIVQDIVSDKNVTWNGGINCGAPPVVTSIQTTTNLIRNGVPAVPAFDVQVYPNPSTKDFHLQLINGNKLPVTISIRDNTGKLLGVSKHYVFENSNIIFGQNIVASGIYFSEIRQGANYKVVKLIKIH